MLDGLASGPVLNATNSGKAMYLRTYIAEVSLCYRNGKLLELYAMKNSLVNKVWLSAALGAAGVAQWRTAVIMNVCSCTVWRAPQISELRAVARMYKGGYFANQHKLADALKQLAALEEEMCTFDSHHAHKLSNEVSSLVQ